MAFIPGKFILLAVITLALVDASLRLVDASSSSRPLGPPVSLLPIRIPIKIPPNQRHISSYNGTIDETFINREVALTVLNVAFSRIDAITEEFIFSAKNLESLIINGNRKFPKITKQFISSFPKLNFVKIYNNDALEIDDDAFTDLADLRILILDNQNYKHVSKDLFKGLNLTLLSLVDSKVEDIDVDAFSTLPELEELHLSYNKLTEIKPGTFKGLDKLNDLWLHINKLSNINWDSFDKLPSLTFLDLANNQLTTIDAKKMLEIFPKLQKINLPDSLLPAEKETKPLVEAKIVVNINDYGV